MTRGQRLVLVGVALVVAVVAFVVLQPDDESSDSNQTQQATQTNSSDQTTTKSETTSTDTTPAKPRFPAAQRIVVRTGEPVGGVKAIKVKGGEVARIVVVSDVADEVHVHGYDRSVAVAPGKPGRLRFRADADGVFEIELEERALHIANLEVGP